MFWVGLVVGFIVGSVVGAGVVYLWKIKSKILIKAKDAAQKAVDKI